MTKPDLCDPTFNRAYSDMAEHYGCFLDPARVRKPKDNGYVERVIGSIRKECLDHLIIVNESHLRNFLKKYIHDYHNQRTHLGLKKDAPVPRKVQAVGMIESVPVANGLHHYYYRQAA